MNHKKNKVHRILIKKFVKTMALFLIGKNDVKFKLKKFDFYFFFS
jgi:hypothetical protein